MTVSVLIDKFIQATNYTPDGNGSDITRVVIHDMEFPEKDGAAETVANFFKNQKKDPPGGPFKGSSAHYCCDNRKIIGCVKEEDRAWHAPPNGGSIGIEHAGYGSQSSADWKDSYSLAMLIVSSRLTADICRRHSLPVVWLTAADLLAGRRGITSHANVSAAWHKTNHTDPGPNFPVRDYLDLVNAALGVPPQEDDMTPAQADKMIGLLEKIDAHLSDLNGFWTRKAGELNAATVGVLESIDKKLG